MITLNYHIIVYKITRMIMNYFNLDISFFEFQYMLDGDKKNS